MSSYINKSELFAALTGKPVEWDAPGIGKILLRGLTIQEFDAIRNKPDTDNIRMMLEWITLCLVEPKLDASDVEQLWQAKPGLIQPLGDKIAVLSGIKEDDDLEKKVGNGS